MVDDPTSRRRQQASSIAEAYRDSHEVMSICLSLGVFTGGGYWLDLKTGWLPLFTVSGVLLGMVGAAVSLRNLLKRLEERNRRKNESSDFERPGDRD